VASKITSRPRWPRGDVEGAQQCRRSAQSSTQLAEAAGYSNYGAANHQYGTIGKAVYEGLLMPLPKSKDVTPIYTSALARAGDATGKEGYWVWKLRPVVSAAI